MNPCVPDALPLTNLDIPFLLPFVSRAQAAIGRYDGLLAGIPNPALLLSPLTVQEAVLSSRIEGTQTTVDEVLEHDAGLIKDKRRTEDVREVVNYRRALMIARAELEHSPMGLYFVRQLHGILMAGAREGR